MYSHYLVKLILKTNINRNLHSELTNDTCTVVTLWSGRRSTSIQSVVRGSCRSCSGRPWSCRHVHVGCRSWRARRSTTTESCGLTEACRRTVATTVPLCWHRARGLLLCSWLSSITWTSSVSTTRCVCLVRFSTDSSRQSRRRRFQVRISYHYISRRCQPLVENRHKAQGGLKGMWHMSGGVMQ